MLGLKTPLFLYIFLSQIFDYGNTSIEKCALFYKRLLPLLEFGRERTGIDLPKLVLTHHHLKNLGTAAMPLGQGETPKLAPITAACKRRKSLADRDHREGE
jgi:type I restriction enzyme R subunit